jgi:probable phosphoglycerate mutase
MTTFYLIRHGSNDYFTHTLVGRTPGIHLNETGLRESETLADALVSEGIQKIISSPLERCRETAEPLAKKLELKVETSAALTEVDFGGWTGRRFAELEQMEPWKQWNAFRSGTRPPQGESMIEVQGRMVSCVQNLARDFSEQRIALVSHGDPLRTLILYFLGTPSEFIRRLELSPASVSVLAVSNWDAQLQCLNIRCGDRRFRL